MVETPEILSLVAYQDSEAHILPQANQAESLTVHSGMRVCEVSFWYSRRKAENHWNREWLKGSSSVYLNPTQICP